MVKKSKVDITVNGYIEKANISKGTAFLHQGVCKGSLRTRVFETRTATGKEHLTCQDSGVSQIFILIISNREKIPSNINIVV